MLLILAGISIAMLTGDNGLLTKTGEAKVNTNHGEVYEAMLLEAQNYYIQKQTGEIDEEMLAYFQRLKIVKEGNVIDVQKLLGKKLSTGNGTELNKDVYKMEEAGETASVNKLATAETVKIANVGEQKEYIINYYDEDSNPKELGKLYNSNGTSKVVYNEELKKLKPGDYVIYDTGIESVGELTCRVLYDASSKYGLQIIVDKFTENFVFSDDGVVPEENTEEYYQALEAGKLHGVIKLGDWELLSTSVEDYNNAIKILNDEASMYINPELAINARNIGSDPANKDAESQNFIVLSSEGEEIEIRDEDTNYESDSDALRELGLLDYDRGYVWASRNIGKGWASGTTYYVSYGLRAWKGVFGGIGLLSTLINEDGSRYNDSVSSGLAEVTIRPVFLLKGDLKTTEGDGKSEETAYRLGI